MDSIKKRLASLFLAAALCLGVTGCAFKTPATVGSIGGVEIPAGVYLLAQYNAYNTASGYVDLATGESANDVKAVLAASGTATVGGEEKTETGREFVADLTLRSVQYYAAVEAKFEELGGQLDDAATAEAAETTDSLWETNGELYTANGISKSSVEAYQLNAQKANAILELLYGADGVEPVTDEEYEQYVTDNCLLLDSITLPLYDSSSYVFATDDQATQIEALAEDCAADLNALQATDETALYTGMYEAASNYLPQVFSTLGVEDVDSTMAYYYVGENLYTPDDLSGYDSADGSNLIKDAAAQLDEGEWGTVNMGTYIMVFCKQDALAAYTVEDLVSYYGLLDTMKSDEVQDMLYEEGAAMEQTLDSGAMGTYKADNIKKTV